MAGRNKALKETDRYEVKMEKRADRDGGIGYKIYGNGELLMTGRRYAPRGEVEAYLKNLQIRLRRNGARVSAGFGSYEERKQSFTSPAERQNFIAATADGRGA